MKSELKKLEERFLDKIAMEINKYGFRRRSKSQEFCKLKGFGRLAFHVSIIHHEIDFDLTADVAIRFDAVEDLVNENDNLLSKTEKKETYSLGAELGNISGEGQKRWTVGNLSDIEPSVKSLMEAFMTIGIPYLNKYSSIENSLDALRGDDEGAWIHSPFHYERAKRAIAIAYLLGDREKFSDIATSKTKFLTARKDPFLRLFLRIRNELERRLRTQK